MSCQYKNECPSASKWWCESQQQNYEKCIPFLLKAYENKEHELEEKMHKAIKALFYII